MRATRWGLAWAAALVVLASLGAGARAGDFDIRPDLGLHSVPASRTEPGRSGVTVREAFSYERDEATQRIAVCLLLILVLGGLLLWRSSEPKLARHGGSATRPQGRARWP